MDHTIIMGKVIELASMLPEEMKSEITKQLSMQRKQFKVAEKLCELYYKMPPEEQEYFIKKISCNDC